MLSWVEHENFFLKPRGQSCPKIIFSMLFPPSSNKKAVRESYSIKLGQVCKDSPAKKCPTMLEKNTIIIYGQRYK